MHLDGSEHNTGIRVLELGDNALTDMLALPLVLGLITRQSIEDGDTTPLGTFVQGDQEFVQNGVVDNEDFMRCAGGNGGFMDICQRGYGICDYLGNLSIFP